METESPILAEFGPVYPKLGNSVEKWRRKARKQELSFAEKKEYGRAVLAAINALNKPKYITKMPSAECASRTFHSEGKDILKAVNAQNLAAHHRAAKPSWLVAQELSRNWSDLEAAYEAAMQEKYCGAQLAAESENEARDAANRIAEWLVSVVPAETKELELAA